MAKNKLDPGYIARRPMRPDALAVSPAYYFVYEVTLPGHYETLGDRRVLIDGGVHKMTTVHPDLAVQACKEAGVIPTRANAEAWS